MIEILKIETNETFCRNVYKKDKVPIELVTGQKVYKDVSTGVIEETVTDRTTYYIPYDKFEGLVVKKGGFYAIIYGKEVSIPKESYDKIWEKISNIGY